MDRNTIFGLVIIFVILIGFGYFNAPSKEEREALQRKNDSLALVQAERHRQLLEAELNQKVVKPDTLQVKATEARMGSFAPALTGEEKFIVLKNDLMKLKVSTLGGRIYSAEILNYTTYKGDPLVLFDGKDNTFGLQFWGNNNDIQTQSLFFEANTNDSILSTSANAPSQTLVMRLNTGTDSYIEYIYTLKHGSHLVDFDIHFVRMSSIISGRVGTMDLLWNVNVPQLEKGAKNEISYTTISLKYPNDEYEELSSTSDEAKEAITTKVKWVAFKQQFFSSILVANDNFVNADLKSVVSTDGKHLKHFNSRISLPFIDGKDETLKFNFYFGPNHFNTLKEYDQGFEKLVPLGRWIIRWINRYVIIVFGFLGTWIDSYGLIIFILTLLIKIILLPLTYKSYLSSAKMRVLKPQVDEIGAKFPKKEDALKKQQATMAMYKKAGVNPLGGCIPILIQFPILIAMFRFFPASFELRQESFLWADDLSSYDSILTLPFEIPMYGAHISLFTLLMAGALFITSKMSTEQMGDTNAQIPGMKFMMIYLMPIMMIVWFNNYSSGLSYYYFLSNMFTLGQTLLIRRFVDDRAILAKLNENAKKPVKKSKFQAKLEEFTRQQQQKTKR